MIATLISLNRLEEREIGTKSYFIASLSDNVLDPQSQIMDDDESNFSEMKNSIIDKRNNIVGNREKDENQGGLLMDMKSFKESRDSVKSRLHRMK